MGTKGIEIVGMDVNMLVALLNQAFSDEYKIVGFAETNPNSIKYKKALRITLSQGLFGFVVVEERELID